jgi:aspartyl-tRNA(Asn)/glutamyl-tRNA(Gln) amidotransferase subunit A
MLSVSQLVSAYRSGTTTPSAEMARVFAVIRERDTDVHAFLDTYETAALAAAEAASTQYATATVDTVLPALLGVPVALKNNILNQSTKATAGSKILEHYIATYDATIVTRLKDAGAIIVGATNLDEFAMGGSTENSAFGPTRNPLDTTRVPGGSSGGSAAAVAMEAVPVAIGTDTGGSVRQPASYCGVVGFKPTYGAVSRYGLIAMGSSLDQAGPLTTTVADAELVHDIMAGLDPYDATTIAPDTYPAVPTKATYTIGIPRSFMASGVDAGVLEVFEAHCAALTAAGHTLVDIDLPLFEQGLAAYYIVMPAEVSSNTARYDGMRYGHSAEGKNLLEVYEKSRGEGFGAEVKRRILLGTYVLSSGYYDAYYGKAETVRAMMRSELAECFKSVDIILTPTAPTPAFKLGEQSDPLSMYRQDIFTVPVNLTGVPALSIPAGTVEEAGVSLPVGVQYIGPHGGDARLFDLGKKMYDNRTQ